MSDGTPKRTHPTKDSLRRRFRKYRTSLSESEYVRISHAVTDQVMQLPEIQRAKTVHAYWPILDQQEIDTRPLIHWLKATGREIVLPVVLTFHDDPIDSPRLAHVCYSGEEELRLNRWGIAEPPPGESVSLNEVDAVIVPALGAGRNGYRVGFGLGYYDEFLGQVNAPTICLVYDQCFIEHVPFEPHDIPVHVFVSERTVFRPPRTPVDA